jgi:guanylate kinase
MSQGPARLVVLAGPSGVGKSSVIAHALAQAPETWLSVSATTRAPRPGEKDGVNYFYLSEEDFDQMISTSALIEWASYAGNRYGTPRQPVEEKLAAGTPVLLEIEVQGAQQIRETMPDAVLVFLEPPTWADLEARLAGRGTESQNEVQARLDAALKELEFKGFFDHVIVNDDVIRAARELVQYLS